MKIKIVREIWKVCSNEECAEHSRKSKYEEGITYCPYCGGTLYHVCKHPGCYERVRDPKLTLCEKHIAEKHGKNKTQMKDIAANTDAAGKTLTGAVAIATTAASVIPVIQKSIKSLTKRRK